MDFRFSGNSGNMKYRSSWPVVDKIQRFMLQFSIDFPIFTDENGELVKFIMMALLKQSIPESHENDIW